MKYSESLYVTWTDGGNPSSPGCFDGAGSMNDLLLCLFNGNPSWQREGPPVGAEVMGHVKYGTRLKVSVTIETEEQP